MRTDGAGKGQSWEGVGLGRGGAEKEWGWEGSAFLCNNVPVDNTYLYVCVHISFSLSVS